MSAGTIVMRLTIRLMIGVFIGVSTHSGANAQDIYIGTLIVQDGQAVLKRCDIAENRYILGDAPDSKTNAIAKFLKSGATAYGEVIGSYNDDDGVGRLAVYAIDNLTPGKSCHLADALAGLSAAASPGVVDEAKSDNAFDPLSVSLEDAINCRLDARTYNGFALNVGGNDGVAKARKWRLIKTDNPFLNEYQLPAPLSIAGMKTARIAFSSSGVLAMLDLADPTALAKAEQIENQADPAVLFKGMGLTPEQMKALPGGKKFLGEREIVNKEEKDETLGLIFTTKVKRAISTVSSHPGKTLYGCSYRIDFREINDGGVSEPKQ
jgi:hypothetical protein